MEEENGEAGDEVDNGEHRVIDTQPGPLTQMLREAEYQDIGGKGEEKTKEKVEKVEEEVAREVSGDLEESEESEDGDEGSNTEKKGENKGNGGWEKQGRKGRERRRAMRRKQHYSDIGEDGMSPSRSSSCEEGSDLEPFSQAAPWRRHGREEFLTLSQWSSNGNPVCLELRPPCTLECHWRNNCC